MHRGALQGRRRGGGIAAFREAIAERSGVWIAADDDGRRPSSRGRPVLPCCGGTRPAGLRRRIPGRRVRPVLDRSGGGALCGRPFVAGCQARAACGHLFLPRRPLLEIARGHVGAAADDAAKAAGPAITAGRGDVSGPNIACWGIALGVNIDHVATLRQARRGKYPDPLQAALLAEQSGADSITLHLREDRRHIQDRDVTVMREALQTRMNLEMAVTDEMIQIAQAVVPQDCCLVPESREEITTEGGLDVAGQSGRVAEACKALGASGIRVSLFIDPSDLQIQAAQRAGAPVIELHTGTFANAEGAARAREL